MKEQQPEFTLDELLQFNPLSPADLTEEDQIWLGCVPGQYLPDNFLEMDANELRQLFITNFVPADVWAAANNLFSCDTQHVINWLCNRAVGLGGLRPLEAIRTPQGKETVMNLIVQLTYGILP